MLTLDLVQKALPATLKRTATQQLVDDINNAVADPIVAEQIRDNFISYTGVLKDGRFKTEDYLSAVMFVSFKLMGQSNKEAYMRAFPARFAALQAKGTSEKDISAYVTSYAKGKLVNLILEQTMIPSWVLNQETYQKAINVQFELMTDPDVSPKVRSDAANSILTHLKKPEALKAQLEIDVKENSGMNELREVMSRLAQQQQSILESGGATIRDITEQKLIEGSAVEI